MRHEYNKLISLFPNNYEEKYCLLTIERDKNWHRSYGKLCDNRTIEIEETRNKSEGIGTGTTVNTVVPGFVATPWQNEKPEDIKQNIYRKTAIHRFATVDEIVDAFRFCIDNSFVNGSQIEVNGGYCYE